MFEAAFKIGVIIAGVNMLSAPANAAKMDIDKLQNSIKRLKDVTADLGKLGAVASGIGLLTKRAVGEAVHEFAAFERQMAEVHTMLGSTYEGFEQLERGVKDVLAAGPHAGKEVTRALYNILSAGVAASDALKVLELSSKAAVAGVTDINTAADVGTTILNSYSMPASRLGEVFDQLFTIVKLGKTTFGELGMYLGEVTSIAAAAHVPFNELAAAMALLTKSGVRTPEAVTAIKALIRDLASADVQKKLADIGGESLAAAAKSGRLVDVMGRLAELGYTELSKLQEIFPNIRSSLAAVIAALHPDELRRFNEQMRNSTGAMAEAAGIMENTLGYQLDRLRNQWAILKESIGKALAPIVRYIVSGFSKAADAIRRFSEAHPTMMQLVTALAAVLGMLTGVVGAALSALAAIGALAGPVGTAIGLFRTLGIVVRLNNILFNLFNLTLFGCPIFWLIAAVGALIAALYLLVKHWDSVRKAVVVVGQAFIELGRFVWVGLTSAVERVLAWFGGVWAKFKDAGKRIVLSIWEGIKSVAMAPVRAVREMVEKIGRLIIFHSPPLEGPLKDIDKTGTAFVQTIAEGIRAGADYLKDAAALVLRAPAHIEPAPAYAGGTRYVTQNITIKVEGTHDPVITAERVKEALMGLLGEA